MDISCYLPKWIQRVFHVQDTCKASPWNVLRGLSSEQIDAARFYDGLAGGTPDQRLTFPVFEKNSSGQRTGRMAQRTTSIRDLCLLDGDYSRTTQRLQSVYDGAKREGLITESPLSEADRREMLATGKPWLVTNQTRNSLLADATGILRAPFPRGANTIADPYNPTDPRAVADWFPNARSSTVQLTPRVLDRQAVRTERLRILYADLVMGIHGHLRSRNAPMVFHPLNVALSAPIPCNVNAYSNVDNESGSRGINQWRADNGDLNYLLQHSVLGYSFDSADPLAGPRIGGNSSQWLWNESLDRRFPLTTSTGRITSRGAWDDLPSRLSWPIWTADPLLELLRLVNAAKCLLDSGNVSRDPRAALVDISAAQTVYHGAQVQAYVQVNRPMGSNVLGYRENIDAENLARRAASRGNLGIPGYQATGDDVTDITFASIGTVALAVSKYVEKGDISQAVISAVIGGCRILYTFLAGPDAPRNPYDYPIRMLGGKTEALHGISVKAVLETSPAYRIR